MAQRTLKRVLAGGALIAALTLTTPTPAQAAGLSAESLWGWLSSLWAGPAPIAPSGHVHARKPSPRIGPLEKLGPCIDPNGGTGSTGTSGSSCTAGFNTGPDIDPNS
jgi:hypothetical protein